MTNYVNGYTALKSDEKKEAVKMTVVKNEVKIEKADLSESKEKVKPMHDEIKPDHQKSLSFDQIREKGEMLFQLLQKFDEVKKKSDDLKSFKISHNNDLASIIISDASGRSFKSQNSKAISKFIDFCGAQMSDTLIDLENEMRKLA